MTTPFWQSNSSFDIPCDSAQILDDWQHPVTDSAFVWPSASTSFEQAGYDLPEFLLPPASQAASLDVPVASTSQLSEPAQKTGNVQIKRRRTKLGCVVCKSFKKGCTMEKPSCKRCAALGYECSYPDPPQPKKISHNAAPKKRNSQQKNSQLVEATASDGALVHSNSSRDPSLAGWPRMDNRFSINDPVFDAFSASNPYSTPSISYSAFQSTVNPAVPNVNSNTAFMDLLKKALTDDIQADLLAGIYAVAHWLAAYPAVLQSCIVPVFLGNNSYHVPFHRIFLSSQKAILPANQVFHDVHLPAGTDDVIASQADMPKDDRFEAAEREGWRNLLDASKDIETRVCGIIQIAYMKAYTTGAVAYRKYWSAIRNMMLTIQPLGSVIDVSQFSVEHHFSVLGWVWADVLESVTAVQSPTFRYTLSSAGTMHGIGISTGSPDQLCALLAQISALAHESHPNRSLSIEQPRPHIVQAAEELAERIRSVPAVACSSSCNSMLNVSQLACQELWRQATWIQFHQGIFRRPADHPEIKAALRCMLQLFDVASLQLSASFRGPLALPIFLASSVALTEEDRKKCRRLMENLGTGMLWQEALQLILLVWSESDEKGHPVDFRDLVVEGKGCASFV